MALEWHNTQCRYGLVAAGLHWMIALLILGALLLGVVMTSLAPADRLTFSLYQWHKSLGVLIFVLSLGRLGWRLADPPPPLPAGMAGWERAAARAVHGLLYALMLGMPLIGWMLVSASPWNIPTTPFGLFTLPHLPWLADQPDKQLLEAMFKRAHVAGAISLALLLAIHVAAALHHHLVRRDDVLVRMLPWQRRRPVAAPSHKGTHR